MVSGDTISCRPSIASHARNRFARSSMISSSCCSASLFEPPPPQSIPNSRLRARAITSTRGSGFRQTLCAESVDFDFIAFGAPGVSVPVEVPEADPAERRLSGNGDSLAVLIAAADRLLDGRRPGLAVGRGFYGHFADPTQAVLTLAGAVAGPDQHALSRGGGQFDEIAGRIAPPGNVGRAVDAVAQPRRIGRGALALSDWTRIPAIRVRSPRAARMASSACARLCAAAARGRSSRRA